MKLAIWLGIVSTQVTLALLGLKPWLGVVDNAGGAAVALCCVWAFEHWRAKKADSASVTVDPAP
jgi:hypothetical protein